MKTVHNRVLWLLGIMAIGWFIFALESIACPTVQSITVNPNPFCVDRVATGHVFVVVQQDPPPSGEWLWDPAHTWNYQIKKEGGNVFLDANANEPAGLIINSATHSTVLQGPGKYWIRARALGKDKDTTDTAWGEWSGWVEFIVLKIDLDGQELQAPPPPQNWKDVPDDQEVNPGVLLVSAKTRLLVQDPGANVGKYKLTWTDPAPNKHLKLVGTNGPNSPIETDCAGPWPKEYMAVAAGNWDYSDAVEVTLTHSLVDCSDVVKLVGVKVESVEWLDKSGNPITTANDHPTAGIGLKYYPDAITPTGDWNDTVKVRVTIAPPISGIQVYLREFDPDDPSANSDVVDNDTNGGDNRGAGILGSTYETTDGSGQVTVDYLVAHQPGDNHRVAATIFDASNLSILNDNR